MNSAPGNLVLRRGFPFASLRNIAQLPALHNDLLGRYTPRPYASTTPIAWDWATLFDAHANRNLEGTAARLSSTDRDSQQAVCAKATTCETAPVRNKTRGQLKSLDR